MQTLRQKGHLRREKLRDHRFFFEDNTTSRNDEFRTKGVSKAINMPSMKRKT
ncbi:hypothetical protein Sjap_003349 [Stephania japonica]|uniref:Uncharacterized protein n=1 Tax=Stephania japonica TaxID=461633 RepID=A0AAP0KQB3_9MAGN